MIISHSRRFTFVHIHKAGGTSMERALEPCLAWNDLILGSSELGEKIQEPFSKRFGLNKHSSIAEIEAVCGSRYVDEYFLFALVRHPVDRLCSIYNFVASALNNWAVRQNISLGEVRSHVTPQAKKKTPALKWASSKVFMETGGFSEFIRAERLREAPGFRSQASVLSGGGGSRIKGAAFRLEDYPSWAETIARRLELDFALPHANQSATRLIEADTVSLDDRLFIRSEFAADYELFGYRT